MNGVKNLASSVSFSGGNCTVACHGSKSW
jgi:hypothetical protein